MNFIINKHFSKNTEEYHKAQLFVWNIFIGLMMSIIISLIVPHSPVYKQVSHIQIQLFTFSILVFMYFTGNLKLCTDLTCLGLLVVLFKPTIITGGVSSQIFIWFILSPVCALVIRGFRRGLLWAFITLIAQITVYLADSEPLTQIYVKADKVHILINHIIFELMILGLMLAYENIKLKQQKTIQEQLDILLEQRRVNLEVIEQLRNTEYALKTSNKELKSFVFGASHDLKELLRMVSMHVQVLRKKLSNYIDDTTEQHIGFVVSGVKNMEELLRKLINHEQVGDNLTTKSKVNLNEICYFAIKEVNAKINNITIQTHVDDLPSLCTHEREIAHLFRNLIDNALKFRKDDVVPSLSITYTEDETEYLFKITDNGLGIKTEYQTSVFDLFFRLNNRRDYEGSGIGLATCKKIVILMGGRIWLESKEQEGTTIFFTANKSMVK